MYTLPIPENSMAVRRWLLLGVAALAAAGAFALLLGLARTPALASIGRLKDVFHVSLVVHVNLSVLVWFLSMTCLLWQLAYPRARLPYLTSGAFWCCAAGAALMALSPFTGAGEPLMSNYVPMLTNLAFTLGLALFACGVLLMALHVVSAGCVRTAFWPDAQETQRFGAFTAALMLLLALAAFAWSYLQIPTSVRGEAFYEILFWGGGHLLQFVFVQTLMMTWLWLVSSAEWKLPFTPRFAWLLYLVNFLVALAGILPYWTGGAMDDAHRDFFTRLMIFGGGIAPTLLLGALFFHPSRLREGKRGLSRHSRDLADRGGRNMGSIPPSLSPPVSGGSAFVSSILLFAYGGALGFLIEGVNVTIPAHYHGSIVGITLALMGLAYALCNSSNDERQATSGVFWQPVVYATGQALHITGLAVSGGYGVLRKTPGADGLPPEAVFWMGIMGLGHLLAMIGGLWFVIAIAYRMRYKVNDNLIKP